MGLALFGVKDKELCFNGEEKGCGDVGNQLGIFGENHTSQETKSEECSLD